MKNITVLMSTYNGSKYIKDQVQSLLNQKDVNIKILIRDDGSKDNTVELLKKYSKEHSNIKYFCGKNLGPALSFIDLLAKTEINDFFAFCDQDDVWLDNKLISAIDMIESKDQNIPLLYHSNLDVVDENLQFIRKYNLTKVTQRNKFTPFVENLATGCTMVFNKNLYKLLISNLPKVCSMHDTWVHMVGSIFGQVVYDFNSYILYRQHANNVIGCRKFNVFNKIFIRICRVCDRNLQPRYTNAKEFLDCYSELLDNSDKANIRIIVDYKKSMKNRIKLLLNTRFITNSIFREMKNRILILLGLF